MITLHPITFHEALCPITVVTTGVLLESEAVLLTWYSSHLHLLKGLLVQSTQSAPLPRSLGALGKGLCRKQAPNYGGDGFATS